jgi:hypothetical protein
MTLFRNPLAAGAAVIAVIGVAAVASAAIDDTHVLTVRLPDGGVERILYTGDVAPKVSVRPASQEIGLVPADDPFDAGFDRVFADMDRRAAAMIARADAMEADAMRSGAFGPSGLMRTNLGGLPEGVRGYSVVTTIEGGKACTRRFELTSSGEGRAPKVLTSSSGDCQAAQTPMGQTPMGQTPMGQTPMVPTSGSAAVQAPSRAPALVQANYRGDRGAETARGLAHQVAVDD